MAQSQKLFAHALVFKVDFPSERIVFNPENSQQNAADLRLITEIVSAVESAAFYDGYYFATGFAAGSCRLSLCANSPCRALQAEGCRHQAFARPSMEAVGIDVFRLATLLGWDIYPIGKTAKASIVPHGTRLGLVLIA